MSWEYSHSIVTGYCGGCGKEYLYVVVTGDNDWGQASKDFPLLLGVKIRSQQDHNSSTFYSEYPVCKKCGFPVDNSRERQTVKNGAGKWLR